MLTIRQIRKESGNLLHLYCKSVDYRCIMCDEKKLNTAITLWIMERLERKGVLETPFSKQSGLGIKPNGQHDNGRKWRSLKTGRTKWGLYDLCLVAAWLNIPLSSLIHRIEIWLEDNKDAVSQYIEALDRKKEEKNKPAKVIKLQS